MMYPYMTLSNGTEIVHSHLITKKNPPEIEANFECPIDDGIKSRFKYAVKGIGFVPDIWALNTLDIMKNLWRITEDYELKIKFSPTQIINHDNYQKYDRLF